MKNVNQRDPGAAAAKINAKYALAGVVIAAVLGLGGAVISNWDKLFGPKPSPRPAIPTQTSGGAQSPNINGARDVTIQYGAAAKEEVPAKKEAPSVAGKWRTQVFTNAYDRDSQLRLTLELIQQGSTLIGTVTQANPDGSNADTRVINDGKIMDKAISFYTRGETTTWGNGTRPYKESYFGTANESADEITFKRVDDMPSGGEPETFTAKRLE